MNVSWTLYFDGGYAPRNPGGIATYGWVLLDPDGDEVHCGHGHACSGDGATNNVAEFAALEAGLQYASRRKLNGPLRIRGDSKLVVMVVAGKWRCKKPHLQKRLVRINKLLASVPLWEIAWIPREENQRADRLSNQAYVAECKRLGIPAIPFSPYRNHKV